MSNTRACAAAYSMLQCIPRMWGATVRSYGSQVVDRNRDRCGGMGITPRNCHFCRGVGVYCKFLCLPATGGEGVACGGGIGHCTGMLPRIANQVMQL